MTAAVFDFPDIRSRMLGEDKPASAPTPPLINPACFGCGTEDASWVEKPPLVECLTCGAIADHSDWLDERNRLNADLP